MREEAGASPPDTGSAEALHACSDSLHLMQETVELRQGQFWGEKIQFEVSIPNATESSPREIHFYTQLLYLCVGEPARGLV